eukprot:g25301.t1
MTSRLKSKDKTKKKLTKKEKTQCFSFDTDPRAMATKRAIFKCGAFVLDLVSTTLDLIIQAVGPVLSCVAIFLILSVTYQFFVVVLPQLMIIYGTLQAELIAIVGVWFLVNLLYNYFMTQRLGPGYAPESIPQDKLALLAEDPETPEGQAYRFCRKCNVVKPMRAHHCSVCKRCVLKMDHHCPCPLYREAI